MNIQTKFQVGNHVTTPDGIGVIKEVYVEATSLGICVSYQVEIRNRKKTSTVFDEADLT